MRENIRERRRVRVPAFLQFIIVVVVLALVSTGLYTVYHLEQGPNLSLPTNTTVVTAVQHVGRLETTTYTIQKIIVYDPDPNSWWNFLGSEKKLFVVYGTVTAGIDLSTLNANEVQIQGTAPHEVAVLNAPDTQILGITIDPTRTQVYDADTGIYGLWNQNIDANTTIHILAAAQNTLKSDACKDGILQQAASSAKEQLSSLLTTLGFSSVAVNVSAGNCS